ncbi:type IV pilin [Halorarius litoreus]|uniref:type IV pilin n=1 Tax=Halorarius litoreus TaxID=2962676 RepID=UPI0020CDD91B|nr:type IV pilin N-terminal domain-containing protein [Halorarius litoreus]
MLERLKTDARGVTPVVGILMMIAVAIILASLVSIQAFGLFGVANDPGPNMDIAFNYSTSAPDTAEDSWGRNNTNGTYAGLLTFTLEQGEEVSPQRFEVVGAANLDDGAFASTDELDGEEFYEVGDTLRVWVEADDTVVIVWRDPGGEKTTAVAVWDHGQ